MFVFIHTCVLLAAALALGRWAAGLEANEACESGWPELYIYTVYDRIFGDSPAKNTVYTPYIYGFGQNTTYEFRYVGLD